MKPKHLSRLRAALQLELLKLNNVWIFGELLKPIPRLKSICIFLHKCCPDCSEPLVREFVPQD